VFHQNWMALQLLKVEAVGYKRARCWSLGLL